MDKETFDLLMDNEKEWRGWMIRQMLHVNGRVRRLEVWRGYIAGAVSVIILFELWKAFI